VFPIKFADYGINLVSSGIITNKDVLKDNLDLVRRMMAACVKAVEASVQDPTGAADAILAANPKGGKRDTLMEGFALTIPLYKDPPGKSTQPFRVSDQNMTDTVSLMVEYGGLDALAKDNPQAFYTNDLLPKPSSM
jgi:NitT/TauT family transport system substrate-binding protein